MQRVRGLLNQYGAGQLGALAKPQGGHVIAPIRRRVRGRAGVDLEKIGAAAGAEHDQVAGMQ